MKSIRSSSKCRSSAPPAEAEYALEQEPQDCSFRSEGHRCRGLTWAWWQRAWKRSSFISEPLFQLAIITPWINLIGYDTATAQSFQNLCLVVQAFSKQAKPYRYRNSKTKSKQKLFRVKCDLCPLSPDERTCQTPQSFPVCVCLDLRR